MNQFDQELKTYAKNEPIFVPNGFDDRIEKVLTNLSAKKVSRAVPFKILLVATILLIFSTATLLASPAVQRMAKGVISYFNSSQVFSFLSQKTELEKYNSAVGAMVQDQGITLKIENIAIDDGYINVFYTAQKDTPIVLVGSENNPLTWRLSWTAPTLFFKADGQDIDVPALIEKEAYLENENTLKGMERFALTQTMLNNFNLEIYSDFIFNIKGNWSISMEIDKSAVQADSLVVTPGIQSTVTNAWDGKSLHNIKIDKVVISPFGSQLIIKEIVNECRFFNEFALMDDQGNYLDIVPSQRHAGIEGKIIEITNSFEFLGGNTKIKSLTLIPLIYGSMESNSYPPPMVTASIDSVPFRLQQSQVGAIVIDKIDLSNNQFKITYHSDGVLPNFIYFFLLDQKNRIIDKDLAVDETFDRQTRQHIYTYTFSSSSFEKMTQIKKIGIQTLDIKLNTKEQIVIPLQ